MTDWIITVPKTVAWEDYEKELHAATQGAVLNYRVSYNAGVDMGDRVFVLWNGRIRGFMLAINTVYLDSGLMCAATQAYWKPGWFVRRSGKFYVYDGGAMKGFRGIRRTHLFEGLEI